MDGQYKLMGGLFYLSANMAAMMSKDVSRIVSN